MNSEEKTKIMGAKLADFFFGSDLQSLECGLWTGTSIIDVCLFLLPNFITDNVRSDVGKTASYFITDVL